MPKGDDGEEEVPKYKNSVSQNLEAAKQIQHKIDLSFRKISKTSFDKYAQELQQKNTYFNNTKIPEVNSKDLANDKLNSIKKFSGAITKILRQSGHLYFSNFPAHSKQMPSLWCYSQKL